MVTHFGRKCELIISDETAKSDGEKRFAKELHSRTDSFSVMKPDLYVIITSFPEIVLSSQNNCVIH